VSGPQTNDAPATGRAGRNLPVAIASGVGLGVVILASLLFEKALFMLVVVACVLVAVWELDRGLRAKDVNLPQEPLMIGGVVMVLAAYLRGAAPLVTATAVTGLVTMLWLLRRGVDGFVRDATASIFTLFYVPFLGSFVALLLAEDKGVKAILTFIIVTIASDIGGYVAGVLFGRHPMAPVISPKKSWEGFAGSVLFCSLAGVLFLTLPFHRAWWTGLLFGLGIVITASMGDLVESVIKRDLEIKDMSNLLPGHGGLMDRLDSMLPCAAVAYLLLSAFAPL